MKKTVARKKRAPLSVEMDYVHPKMRSAGPSVMTVGGSQVHRGGYIWLGNAEDGPCIGYIAIGKFLRLARNIERARLAGKRSAKPNGQSKRSGGR